jgi:hypothetical protein
MFYKDRSLAQDKPNILLKIFCTNNRNDDYLKFEQIIMKAKFIKNAELIALGLKGKSTQLKK